MEDIFIVTEANAEVATGHLMECIVCADTLTAEGYRISFWINHDMDNSLKKRISCKFQEYRKSIEKDYDFFIESVREIQPKAILFNLRKITDAFIKKVRSSIEGYTKIVCIDEFGHRRLSADVIINPMIDPYYWDYEDSKAYLICGAEYLILPSRLEELHQKEKVINRTIDRIVISMGGVDKKNYTLDLMKIVPVMFPYAVMEVIIGGGNENREDIMKRADVCKNIIIRENISNLPDLLYEADLVFCAGGNTLHESACIGTPAIILPSMPHEVQNAKCFVKNGFGLSVDQDDDWRENIQFLCDKIQSYELRMHMCRKGKVVADGRGKNRIVDIINKI